MKNILKPLFTLLLTTVFGLALFSPVLAADGDISASSNSGSSTMNFHITAAPPSNQASITFNSIVISVINIALFGAGAAAALYMVYGGFSYVTAGGDDQKTVDARKMIVNAAIGMIAIAGVYLIFSATRNTADKFAAENIKNTEDL